MLPEDPRDHLDYTVHVFAEHGWTELDYVLSDLRNSILDDHRADHERADLRPSFVLPRPHRHAAEPEPELERTA
jgi:hypothetical protein